MHYLFLFPPRVETLISDCVVEAGGSGREASVDEPMSGKERLYAL